MLLTLLPATLVIAILVSLIVVRLFHQPIAAILRRLVVDDAVADGDLPSTLSGCRAAFASGNLRST